MTTTNEKLTDFIFASDLLKKMKQTEMEKLKNRTVF